MSKGRRVPEAPVVSVCIPVVSEHGLIEGCLDSIAASRSSVATEVVVVANGLGRDGLSPLRGRDDIVLVHSAVNAGFSGGNNLASRIARGPYLLFLNDDSVLEIGFIDRLLRTVQREPSIGAAGGAILSADGGLQEAGSVLWRDGWAAHVGAGRPRSRASYNYVRDADYISANGFLVRREAWDAVGGFDERYYPAYYEDVDLCLALHDHGYRVVYEPRARLRHIESQSTSASFRNFLLIRNRAQLVAKWSAALQGFMDRPDPIDDAAIDAALLCAQRSRGRVLVVEDSADAGEWAVSMLEALTGAGWSVMLSAPSSPSRSGEAEGAVRDHLIDLGVDARDTPPEDLVSEYGQTLEAVVSGKGPDAEPVWRRPDGSLLPLVRRDRDRDDAVLDSVAAAARPSRSTSVRAHDSHGDAPDAVVRSPEAEESDPARRDLAYALADATVRREYAESLEREVAHLRAVAAESDAAFERLEEAFGDKERYIDSLPSVRLKRWVSDRLPARGS